MPKLKPLTKAKRLLQDAVYDKDGCMCNVCIWERQRDAFQIGAKIVYPELKELPLGLANIAYDGYTHQLKYLEKTKKRNELILAGENADKYHLCSYCGNYQLGGKQTGDHWVCDDCAYDVFFCAHCDKLKQTDEAYSIRGADGDIQFVCYECYDGKYEQCQSCRHGVLIGTTERYPYKRNERGQLVYFTLCSHCSAEGMVECHVCGGTTHSKIARSNGQNYYCPACYEEEIGLNGHQYKPLKLRFKHAPGEGKVSEKAFHMGFELEVARHESFINVEGMTHLVKEKMGKTNVYCVHDGTIQRATGMDGFEIVTHPFTWEHYRKVGILEWDRLLMFLRKKGWEANFGGVGFHVHTTKAAWGTHQIYKLLKFVYGNKEMMYTIAQRRPTNYCFMNPEDFDEAVLVAKDKQNRKKDHYSAINLNSGRGASSTTIEFRMFQGTLEPLYLHKNIEFVKSCYEFTREHARMKKKDYLMFIKEYRREYPCLHEFLKMKGVI